MEGQESVNVETTSEQLNSAVESVNKTAPELTGLDKLRADKDFVEKNDKLPPKAGAPTPEKDTTKETSSPAQEKPGSEVPAYTPNFKFKADGKEHDIPEKFRGLIKSKADEDEIKDIFSRAEAHKGAKERETGYKENLGKIGGALNEYNRQAGELRKACGKRDFDSFFKMMNIPQDWVLQWVWDKVEYSKLPPEQKAAVDRERNLAMKAESAEAQVGHASARELNLAAQLRGLELDRTLERVDVKAIREAFDARTGESGSFRNALIAYAQSVYNGSQGKTDLTPDQAFEQFVKMFGIQAPTTPPPAAAAGAAPPAPAAQPPVKVIPNVTGRSSSPVKREYTSIEDLKKRSKEFQDEDNASRSPSQGYLAG